MSQWANHQTTLKLGLIGFMGLLMLIPLALVEGLVRERQGLQQHAQAQISAKWGQPQVLGGPLAALTRLNHKNNVEQEFHLPAELHFDAELAVETRYLGIFEMPVYLASIRVEGRFDMAALGAAKEIFGGTLDHWLLPLAHVRGIRKVTPLTWDKHSSEWSPPPHNLAGLPGIAVNLSDAPIDDSGRFQFEIEIAGTETIEFLPLGRLTTATLTAPWGSPSFTGGYLPHTREIGRDSFVARWQILELNRQFGQVWTAKPDPAVLDSASFGARLYIPAGVYQRVERSIKYGALFVALTFMGFFVAEKVLQLRLHPVQYVFIGGALAVFYLVLLALSEHLPFWLAYWSAAATLAIMIGSYCAAVMDSPQRGAAVSGALSLIYALLYWLVIDEQYSLLAGALAVLVMLGLTLHLTRHIDWYAVGES